MMYVHFYPVHFSGNFFYSLVGCLGEAIEWKS